MLPLGFGIVTGILLLNSYGHYFNRRRVIETSLIALGILLGALSAGHARAILASDDQEAVAEQVIGRGLSVRQTEDLVRNAAAGPKKASGPRKATGGSKDTDTAALEADLEDVLGMTVDIADRGGAGEVRIKYATLEQLDELCRRLTRT